MSTVKVLFLILLWQMAFLNNEAALVVFAPSPHRAQLGENFVLPCFFKVDDPSINIQFIAIVWYFQGNEVLRFDRKGTSSQPRMFINKQDISKGIANMEIKKVTISDIGKYRCMVIYSPQKEFKDIDLNMYATPSVMIKKVEENKTSFALCSVIGFYPRDITVEFLQDRTIIEDSILSAYHTNADGTYSVNRTWKIPTDVLPEMLSCSVHHETLSRSVQKDLQLVYQGDNITGVVVGCIVGVIILILVLVFLWYYKRKSDHQKFMVKDIESPGCIVGEKTTLCCEAFNCTGDVKVTWIIKLRDGTQHEVSDMGSSNREEEQPLMSTEYQVTKEYDTQMKGHVTTKLTFIPSISRHVGSTVSCKIVHQKKPVEKTFKVKSFHAKPTFIEPVQFTLSDQGDVQISVKLQRFYPPEMDVEWVSKKGQSEEKIKSEVIKNFSGDTFDMESNCSVSGELFKDPSYKVIVRWKHESLEKPQSREMSVRDLPWHPKLQKFPIECVFQGEEVILQCRVSDYFPDALAVKWFERKMDSQDMVEISSSQKYKIPEISSNRMENKTISSTAVLSYNRFDLSEKAVEFICKAEHPSLDTPIQTSIIQYRDTAQEQQKPSIQHSQLHSGVPAAVSHHPSPQDVFNIMDHQHHPGAQAPESQHPTSQDVSNIMDHQHHPGVLAPEPQHPTSQDVSNIMDHQHHPGAPAPEPQHPTSQDVSIIMDHQHHPIVPAPEPHYSMSQDVSNLIDHQNHTGVPAPEPHHPTPQNMSNLMDPPNHHSVQAPKSQHSPQQVVNTIRDHQHQTDASPLDHPHYSPQDVYNRTHHQNHPVVQASESQHPYLEDVYNMLSHQHYPSAPAPESHYPPLEYINNMVGPHNILISQQHCSPLSCDEVEEMEVQDTFAHHNMAEHTEESDLAHQPLPDTDEMEF